MSDQASRDWSVHFGPGSSHQRDLHMELDNNIIWWFQPSWKIWKSMGRIIPYMKWNIKFMFQNTNQSFISIKSALNHHKYHHEYHHVIICRSPRWLRAPSPSLLVGPKGLPLSIPVSHLSFTWDGQGSDQTARGCCWRNLREQTWDNLETAGGNQKWLQRMTAFMSF
jgi:hypothetical protein